MHPETDSPQKLNSTLWKHALGLLALYVLLLLTPGYAETMVRIVLYPVLHDFARWNEEECVSSPDSEFISITEHWDKGALGWGPKRATLAAQDRPEDRVTIFVCPTRDWSLSPRWVDHRNLELVVWTNREPTRAEREKVERSFAIDGENFQVRIDYREPGQ